MGTAHFTTLRIFTERDPYGDLYLLFVRESRIFVEILLITYSCQSKITHVCFDTISDSSERRLFEPDKFSVSTYYANDSLRDT